MNTINTSPKWWGFSKKPKNWKKYMLISESNDGYDIFELIAENSPMKSRTLTDEEIKELRLEEQPTELRSTELRPKTVELSTMKLVKPKVKQTFDSSHSYA